MKNSQNKNFKSNAGSLMRGPRNWAPLFTSTFFQVKPRNISCPLKLLQRLFLVLGIKLNYWPSLTLIKRRRYYHHSSWYYPFIDVGRKILIFKLALGKLIRYKSIVFKKNRLEKLINQTHSNKMLENTYISSFNLWIKLTSCN